VRPLDATKTAPAKAGDGPYFAVDEASKKFVADTFSHDIHEVRECKADSGFKPIADGSVGRYCQQAGAEALMIYHTTHPDFAGLPAEKKVLVVFLPTTYYQGVKFYHERQLELLDESKYDVKASFITIIPPGSYGEGSSSSSSDKHMIDTNDYQVDVMAAAVNSAKERLGVDRVMFVGVYEGARIAMQIVNRHPNLAGKIGVYIAGSQLAGLELNQNMPNLYVLAPSATMERGPGASAVNQYVEYLRSQGVVATAATDVDNSDLFKWSRNNDAVKRLLTDVSTP
jgi:hypothetical protein